MERYAWVVTTGFALLSLVLHIRFHRGPRMSRRVMREHPWFVDEQVRLGFMLLPGAVFWVATTVLLLPGVESARPFALVCGALTPLSFLVAMKERWRRSRWRAVPAWVVVWERERGTS